MSSIQRRFPSEIIGIKSYSDHCYLIRLIFPMTIELFASWLISRCAHYQALYTHSNRITRSSSTGCLAFLSFPPLSLSFSLPLSLDTVDRHIANCLFSFVFLLDEDEWLPGGNTRDNDEVLLVHFSATLSVECSNSTEHGIVAPAPLLSARPDERNPFDSIETFRSTPFEHVLRSSASG